MYSNKLRGQKTNLRNFRSLEKLSYALLIPTVVGYFGYRFYRQNITEADERALQVQTVEDTFSAQARDNVAIMMKSLREQGRRLREEEPKDAKEHQKLLD